MMLNLRWLVRPEKNVFRPAQRSANCVQEEEKKKTGTRRFSTETRPTFSTSQRLRLRPAESRRGATVSSGSSSRCSTRISEWHQNSWSNVTKFCLENHYQNIFMLSNYTQVLTVLYLYFQLSPCVVCLNLATRSMLQTAQTSISSGTIRASHLTMVKECTTVTSSKQYVMFRIMNTND